jgi:hypothetical protein
LNGLKFVTCPQCGLEHARLTCPTCSPSAALRARPAVTVRGEVVCKHIFATSGVILAACVEQGELRFVYHEAGAYHREDGSVVFRGELDPRIRFRILEASTLVARGGEVAVLRPGDPIERLSVDSDGTGPAFDTNGRHHYWTTAGRLLRDAPLGTEPIGDVLADQTRIWVGPAFGLGFYRASNLSVAFTFDAERRGVNDRLRLPPLRGQLIDASCVFDETRAWLLLALHSDGKTRHLCLTCSRTGTLEAVAEAEAGDGSWLGTLRGKCATQGVLLAATDSGITRIELENGALHPTREFPDAEPFVDASCHLLVGKDGLYVVGGREITALKMKGARP